MASGQKSHQYFPELSSQQDVNRLRGGHRTIKHAMKGNLVYAPIDFSQSPLRILDTSTSDGYWLFDLRNDLGPEKGHTFVGVDIDGSRFPSDYPKDVTLQVQDIGDEWPSEMEESFNLVHQRFGILSAGRPPRDVLQKLLNLVKPGGWIQLVEMTNSAPEDDPLANRQFLYLVDKLVTVQGLGGVLESLSTWVKDAGFVNVKEELVRAYSGAQISDPALRESSVESTAAALEGIVARVKGKSAIGFKYRG